MSHFSSVLITENINLVSRPLHSHLLTVDDIGEILTEEQPWRRGWASNILRNFQSCKCGWGLWVV